MTCFDRKGYKYLKDAAKKAGDIYVVQDEYCTGSTSGVTIAYRPAITNTNCKMLEVAVSYCAAEDKFKKKHGKFQALRKLAAGEVIHMPLAQTLAHQGKNVVNMMLIHSFCV